MLTTISNLALMALVAFLCYFLESGWPAFLLIFLFSEGDIGDKKNG